MSVTVDFSSLQVVAFEGELKITGFIFFRNVECNQNILYLIGLADSESKDFVGTQGISGLCTKSLAFIDINEFPIYTKNTYLFAGIKIGSQLFYSNTRVGCSANYDLGSNWNLSPVSSISAFGICNDALTGVPRRVCSQDGWGVITGGCYCQSKLDDVTYPLNVIVGQNATGQCITSGQMVSECTDFGWKRISGQCIDCPAGDYTINNVTLTINTNGTLMDTVSVSCPDIYGGGVVVFTCEAEGWKNNGACYQIACLPTKVIVGDYIHDETRSGQLGDILTYTCPDGYNNGQYTLTCSFDGWVAQGKCTPDTGTTLSTQSTKITIALTTQPDNIICSPTNIQSGGAIINIPINGTLGENRIYNCPVGFTGAINVECESDGEWEIKSGVCTPLSDATCSETIMVQNGKEMVLPSMKIGQNYSEPCPENYSGNITFTCTSAYGSIGWMYTDNNCVQNDHIQYYSLILLILLFHILI